MCCQWGHHCYPNWKITKLYMQFNPCDKQKYTTLAKHIKRFKRMWLSNVSDFRKICSIQRCTEGFTVCHVITWLSSFISEHDWQQIQIENNENLQSKKTSGTSLWYNFTSNECIVHSSNHDYQNTQLNPMAKPHAWMQLTCNIKPCSKIHYSLLFWYSIFLYTLILVASLHYLV